MEGDKNLMSAEISWTGKIEIIFNDGFLMTDIASKKTLFEDFFGKKDLTHIRAMPLINSIFLKNLKKDSLIKVILKDVEEIKEDSIYAHKAIFYGVLYSFEKNGFYLKYNRDKDYFFVKFYESKAKVTSTRYLENNPYELGNIIEIVLLKI